MRAARRNVVVTLAFLALGLALRGGTAARVFDFNATPEPGQTYTTAIFRMNVPDSPATVRGVYFWVDPRSCDSRYIVYDEHMLGLCGELHFALMGALLDNVSMASGIGDAVLRALAAFADSSGHEELGQSTLFFDGWSWGGQFAYHFTKWDPARVIGFMTQKGGLHDTTAAGDAILVPGYMFIGELDLPYRITNLTGIFEAHRPLGARWTLAMEPGAAHERITDRDLLDPYVRTVCGLRLPPVIVPGEPVALVVIPEEASWLGNRETSLIGSYECYELGRERASWCPSRATAEDWQSFVSGGAVTDTIPCPSAVPDPLAPDGSSGRPGDLALWAWPNPSRCAVTFACTAPLGEPPPLVIRGADGRLVRRICGSSGAAAAARIVWDGRDLLGRPVCAGVYYASLEQAGKAAAIPVLRVGRP